MIFLPLFVATFALGFFAFECSASNIKASYFAIGLCGTRYLDDIIQENVYNVAVVDKFKAICSIVDAQKKNPARDSSSDCLTYQDLDNWFQGFFDEKGITPITPKEYFQYFVSGIQGDSVDKFFAIQKSYASRRLLKVYSSLGKHAKKFLTTNFDPSKYFITYDRVVINDNGNRSVSPETKVRNSMGAEHKYTLEVILAESNNEQFAIYPVRSNNNLIQWKVVCTSNISSLLSTRIISDNEFWAEFRFLKVLSLYRYSSQIAHPLQQRLGVIRARTNTSLASTFFLVVLAGIVELLRNNEMIVVSEDSRNFFLMVFRVILGMRLAMIASHMAEFVADAADNN